MLKLETTVNAIVEAMLPLHKKTEHNALALTISMTYMEHFSSEYDNPITPTRIDELGVEYPFLTVTENNVTWDVTFKLLFIKGGSYQCFSNISNSNNQNNMLDTVWLYETNHDTCWRENAYSTINDELFKIRDTLFSIFAGVTESNIKIPKHVIPNFTNIEKIETLNINNGITGEYKQHIILKPTSKQKPNIRQLLEISTLTNDEVLEREFYKAYDNAIKDFKELKIGTRVYGTFINNAVVSSEVFKTVDDGYKFLWVQLTDVNEPSRKYMVSLQTYGINFKGTHNLLFTNENDYKQYRGLNLIMGTNDTTTFDTEFDMPNWVKPPNGKRIELTEEELKTIPIKDWSPVTNDFI